MIEMVAFLGNPGTQYAKTRHNLGWLCLENIPLLQNLQWKSKFKGEWASLQTGSTKQIILKPDTYMNKSGESIGAAATFFKIQPENVLIVHDDIEIPFGTWQVKKGGGLGGHNGLRSIYSAMGKKEFYRLRLGVGRPARGDVASHVLGRFNPQEEAELDLVYPGIEKILQALTTTEPDKLRPNLQKGKIHN
ncbi:MAG: aminoacyl-tRNA hydrolase [Spirochaetales bacterium]|nr:aminoacyl-tRNA hydrolase [Spirochaetales bacterium]